MLARFGPAPPPRDIDVITRTAGAIALAALAVIHVIDLPGTLGTIPLVGAGYLGLITAAILTAGLMITRSHWLTWAAAGALAASAMGGYILTRTVSGFLGDHGDLGNWHCPLGIAALSIETLLLLLAALTAWQARARAASPPPQTRPATRRLPEYSHPG